MKSFIRFSYSILVGKQCFIASLGDYCVWSDSARSAQVWRTDSREILT